jgi:DNA mismatch repair protein MSH4
LYQSGGSRIGDFPRDPVTGDPLGLQRSSTSFTRTTAPSRVSGRRSRATSYLGSGDSQAVICALSEARGVSPSVGVAFLKLATGEVILSQIWDSQFYVKTIHKLQVFEPSHILIVASACPPRPKSSLYSLIEDHMPGVTIVPFERQFWSESTGLEYIQTLAVPEDVESLKVAIQGNFYATCALAAVSCHHKQVFPTARSDPFP